jgi:hypothetical protein
MHGLQKSIHLTYRTPMHVDELRILDDTPVAASMASSWSVLVLGVSEKHSQQSFAGVVENQDALGAHVTVTHHSRRNRRPSAASQASDTIGRIGRGQSLIRCQHQCHGFDLGEHVLAPYLGVVGAAAIGGSVGTPYRIVQTGTWPDVY